MFIEYGINDSGQLIYIEQVTRGLTALQCPYCGGLLVARKGKIKVPHFAHAGATCRQAERSGDVIAIPAYHNFNLQLPPRVIEALRRFPDFQYADSPELLEQHELITRNKFARNGRGEYELTKRGKIPRGELSLNLFNEVQEALILGRHSELEKRVQDAYAVRDQVKVARVRIAEIESQLRELLSDPDVADSAYDDYKLRRSEERREELWSKRDERDRLSRELKQLREILAVDFDTALVDLRLYRAQWRRLLSCTLYFLRIGETTWCKIGVTTRPIGERLIEVASNIASHLGEIKPIVLGTWEHRGNVELYFKHRYKTLNTLLGELTEYYQVSLDQSAAMLRDLKRMKAKTLTEVERAVLAGEPSAIEQMIQRDQMETKRRANISASMRRRVAKGRPIGRPEGSETRDQLLSKPTSLAIIDLLDSDLSLRDIAARAGVAVNTVRKVKAAFTAS